MNQSLSKFFICLKREKFLYSSLSICFAELRSRLPNSIGDDIVTVLSNSKQALLDFANIRDQRDVEEFNQRYNLNLTIPQEG